MNGVTGMSGMNGMNRRLVKLGRIPVRVNQADTALLLSGRDAVG